MKISFDLAPKLGPYGGGNSFLRAITAGLQERGHEVFFDLSSRDLDFIFLLDPRWNHGMRAYNSRDVIFFLRKNPNTLVIHRINECDERKDSWGMNRKLRTLNHLADHTIVVGSWLKDLDLFQAKNLPAQASERVETVLNGSDSDLFYPDENIVWQPGNRFKIVTHHWSPHPNKGRDVYLYLDSLLENAYWKGLVEFTFVGNMLHKEEFRNTRFIPSLSGEDLASELRRHHCYLTASRNEPGSNHQNDAGLTGLPILFLSSGCLPEYCADFGFSFDSSSELPNAIESVMKNYSKLKQRMKHYPHTHKSMVQHYVVLLDRLMNDKEKLIARRSPYRHKLTFSRLLFPM